MDQPREHRIRLPGDATSPSLARRFVRSTLHDAGLDELSDDALLLTSELCENAVLHAGTAFEISLVCADNSVTVTVTDHGSTAMELRRGEPSARTATHNRGLQIVDTVAAAWGSRHDPAGHAIWFRLGGSDDRSDVLLGQSTVEWPSVQTARWLIHIPALDGVELSLPVLVTELIRRLCDVLPAPGAVVYVNYGDGERELARYGVADSTDMITVPLPLSGTRAGRLCVFATAGLELAELTAERVGLAVESDWARSAARERRTWLTYLAEASELLTHSLDVQLTTTMVPQLIVPRLGTWCAVHLLDDRAQPHLAAVTHIDETAIPTLRANLDARAADLLRRLVISRSDATGLPAPVDGVSVPLRLGDRTLGALSVGRHADRPHTPEEIMMISELSRRATQAIDNAQRNATHLGTAQALQQALLPRALPTADGIRFAATYQPVGAGAEVGGDFYDVVPLSDSRWLAAIGDVCGKGPRAASRTSLMRDVLRVLVRQNYRIPTALTLLHEMMLEADDPEQFATIAVALLIRLPDHPGLSVELTLAGHEKPALIRADGSAQLIGAHGNAVGLIPQFAVHPTHHTLFPGETLIFYTDGITERRRGEEQFGPARLLSTLTTAANAPADKLVAELQQSVQDFSPDPHQDDIAIMAIQVIP